MLTKEQVQFYRDNGYIKLSGIFTEEEINEISEAYNELFARKRGQELQAEWKGEEMKKAAKQEPVVVIR